MKATIVERLHTQFIEIINQIDEGEITLRLTAEENFRKALLLAAASYFETHITESLMDLVRNSTRGNSLVEEFVRNKAISRQYHTLFQWDAGNANSFFGLFGPGFKTYMNKRIKENEDTVYSIKAFLEIGSERNRLVHQNFGTFALEKDANEIYKLYVKARPFVEDILNVMMEYLKEDTENIDTEEA